MKILVDLDGVLSDFVGGCCELFNEDRNNIDWDHCGFQMWKHFKKHHDIPKNVFFETIEDAGSAYWSGLKPFPWAKDLWDLTDNRGDAYICTSPMNNPSCLEGKVEWMQDFFEDRWFRKYAVTPQKQLLADKDTILIDDRPKNVKKFRGFGGHAILFPAPYNHAGIIDDGVEFVKHELDEGYLNE